MRLLLLLAAGTLGGYLAQLVRLPGGAAVGALVAAAALNVALGGRPTAFPRGLDFAALVLVGVSLGAAIGREQLAGAVNLIVPALLILLVFSAVGVVLAVVLQRGFGFDPTTALFAAAPGGMNNMAILAKDAGGDGFAVALVHLVRLVGIFVFVPVVGLISAILLISKLMPVSSRSYCRRSPFFSMRRPAARSLASPW